MLSKNRLEAFSDAVFAVVITLLALELKIPDIELGENLNQNLLDALVHEKSVFFSYFFSFAIIGMYWINHHAFYAFYIKSINRWLNLINLAYLCVLCLIPFSTHLLGVYFSSPVAVMIYGLNIISMGLISLVQFVYTIRSKTLEKQEVGHRTKKQGLVRVIMTPLCTTIGIPASFISPYLALFFFAFPIAFNLIPGGLDFLEKLFGFEIK